MTNQRTHRRAAIRLRLAGAAGVVDLASVMVGIVIVAIIGGILTATAVAAIPWSQDQGAKQSLNTLRIAEAAAKAKLGVYLTEADLAAQKYSDAGSGYADINAAADCYIGAVVSKTGNIYWAESGDNTVYTYKPGDTADCSDLPSLINRAQGKDPDAGNPLQLSYAKQNFDPAGSNEVLSPTTTGGDTYTYVSDTDLTAYGVNFNTATGTFTGKSAWAKAFTQISTSYSHTCASGNGVAWCWGNNGNQQVAPTGSPGPGGVAVGAKVNAPVLVKDSGGTNALPVSTISAGYAHTCAISSGAAYCWGFNNDGELGNGTNSPSSVPVKVGGLLAGKTVTAISAGYYNTCAVADGNAYCWGLNGSGQLGNGNTTGSNTPVAVTGLPTGAVTDISSTASSTNGQYYTCALANGAPYCWGYGANGELGNGANANSTTPVLVTVTGVLAGKSITKLDTGTGHSCVIASADAFCWGNGTNGQLGNGGTASSNAPAAVAGLPAGKVTALSAGRIQTCAVANNTPYCWGDNSYGNFGNNTSVSGVAQPTPTQATVTSPGLQGITIDSVTAGDRHTCWLGASGAYCAGDNTAYNQLGDGTSNTSKTPKLVSGAGANPGLPANVKVTVSSKGYTKSVTVKLSIGAN